MLEPDSAERSEAYLQTILLIPNQSISPNEDPAAPPAQLKAIKKFLDSWMSLDMGGPNRSSQMISNFSRSPSAPTSRNRRRKVTCGCGESRFPGEKSWSAYPTPGNRLQAQTDRDVHNL